MIRALAAALAAATLAACGGPPSTPAPAPAPDDELRGPDPDGLARYLATVARLPADARAREVASWQLDRPTWDRSIAAPFRGLYADYAARFPRATAPLADALHPGVFAARRHFASDPRGTTGQELVRWALPIVYPSAVVELDGHALDVVFVFDGARWRALAGLERAIADAVATLDPTCTYALEHARTPACSEVGYVVASAALGGDRAAFARACVLATRRCGKPAP